MWPHNLRKCGGGVREDKYSLHVFHSHNWSSLTPCTRVLQGKLVVAYLLKKAIPWTHYCIYSNARRGFSHTNGTEICEIIVKFHMKCQTGLLWTIPHRAKPRPVLPNRHVRSALFWDITQRRVVIHYWCFRTALSVPSSRIKKFKRQNRAWLKLTDIVFFFGTMSIV